MAHGSEESGEARAKEQKDAREPSHPEVSAAAKASAERESSAHEVGGGEEGRAARHTERPVAHSVKPPPPAPSTQRGFVWVATLALFGVVGYALRNPDPAPSRASAARAPSQPPARVVEAAAPKSEPFPALAETVAASEPAAAPSSVEPGTPAVADTAANANAALAAKGKSARDTEASRAAAVPPAPALGARSTAPAAANTAAIAPPAAEPALFDHKAANVALDQSAKAASSCRRGTDPSGVARAVVSFAPTGRVTAAVISGPPFAGTETGSCIARTLRQSVVPAFEGEITTVAKTVEVQ